MRLSFYPTKPQLKVFSEVCSNLVVIWLIAIFGTRELLILTLNIVAAIVSLYLALKAEELLEDYD